VVAPYNPMSPSVNSRRRARFEITRQHWRGGAEISSRPCQRLCDGTLKARLTELGGVPLSLTPADFGELVANETEKWGKVVKFASIRPK